MMSIFFPDPIHIHIYLGTSSRVNISGVTLPVEEGCTHKLRSDRASPFTFKGRGSQVMASSSFTIHNLAGSQTKEKEMTHYSSKS